MTLGGPGHQSGKRWAADFSPRRAWNLPRGWGHLGAVQSPSQGAVTLAESRCCEGIGKIIFRRVRQSRSQAPRGWQATWSAWSWGVRGRAPGETGRLDCKPRGVGCIALSHGDPRPLDCLRHMAETQPAG